MAITRVQPPTISAPLSSAVPPWRRWNTLQTLWAGLYLIWALDAVLLLSAMLGVAVHRDAVKGVGKDTAPSIIHALHIKSALADMDANAANELLGEPGKMKAEVDAYEAHRIEASKALIEAARNITFDEEEQAPLESIQQNMQTFEGWIQRARERHDRKDPTFLAAYREAAKVMDTALLPEADKLDKLNHRELEDAYSSLSNRSVGTVFLLLVSGAALLGALIVVQKFLNHRTNRILNPYLVLATLLTFWFVSYTFVTLGSERHRLKVAKEDAFTSIHALWRARATAYSANADESRYLLDRENAAVHQQHFNQNIIALAGLRHGVSYSSIVELARRGEKSDDFSGFLADELNNITFEGERDAAISALITLGTYVGVDDRVRDLQEHGKHAEALQMTTGTNVGESNWAFHQFDQALVATLDINQRAFDDQVERGFAALSYFDLKASIITLAIAVLAFFGLFQRIREYT